MRAALTSMLVLMLAGFAFAADSPAPNSFGDIALGATLHELKERYPEASRNPDSDRHFQVYQVPNLHGADTKSPGAFQIYQGHVVGGQILLDTHNVRHWLDTMRARYGKPDSCTYCDDDPQSATAVWHWGNGTTLKIEEGMLTELTAEGNSQRSAWMARGDADQLADNGDEASDEGQIKAAAPGSTSHKHRHVAEGETSSATPSKPPQHASGWRGYYYDMNSRLEHWLGWSK